MVYKDRERWYLIFFTFLLIIRLFNYSGKRKKADILLPELNGGDEVDAGCNYNEYTFQFSYTSIIPTSRNFFDY